MRSIDPQIAQSAAVEEYRAQALASKKKVPYTSTTLFGINLSKRKDRWKFALLIVGIFVFYLAWLVVKWTLLREFFVGK